ncbi:MAG: glycosyltransferase family 1 protein [Planctomycetota bacterium]
MHIALLTDAWTPQVNGVVRTWQHVIEASKKAGHEFTVIHPGLFKSFAAPKYPEIKLALRPGPKLKRTLNELKPDAIHIATEGPIGQAGRKYCRKNKLPYTTSYHTQFPHYMKAYFGLPASLTYKFIRWFHGPAKATLVPTATVGRELEANGMTNVKVWCRGVNTELFRPRDTYGQNGEPVFDDPFADLPKPIFLYAGRVAVEKNIEAFLAVDLSDTGGSKVVVGDGPIREKLEKQYPDTHFAGYQFGEDLARHYAAADVFVFPSKTDTFGIVMLEANGAGLPVAAYPVTGPIDVVQPGTTGALNDELAQACRDALNVSRESCRAHALSNSWERCAGMVHDVLAPIQR